MGCYMRSICYPGYGAPPLHHRTHKDSVLPVLRVLPGSAVNSVAPSLRQGNSARKTDSKQVEHFEQKPGLLAGIYLPQRSRDRVDGQPSEWLGWIGKRRPPDECERGQLARDFERGRVLPEDPPGHDAQDHRGEDPQVKRGPMPPAEKATAERSDRGQVGSLPGRTTRPGPAAQTNA